MVEMPNIGDRVVCVTGEHMETAGKSGTVIEVSPPERRPKRVKVAVDGLEKPVWFYRSELAVKGSL